jgi:hypothetical protein
MKNTLKTSLILSALLLTTSMSFGQTILTTTTLSSAVSTSAGTTIPLTAVTGITANNTVLFVADGNVGEAMFVNSVSTSAKTAGVTRGYQTLGKARPHASGALVFIVPMSGGYPAALNTVQPEGSCTRSGIPYLPVISAGIGGHPTVISDCVGGVWVNGMITSQNNTPWRLQQPDPGGTIYTSINTTGTTLTNFATTEYCTEIDIPYSKLVTGLGVLNGTVASTDKHAIALYDATGNLIAQSPAAGTTATGASAYQEFSFSTLDYLFRPSRFFALLHSNVLT